ncbi:MAG TPA: hypothetical protein VK661_04365, partial [Planctomycetota bacterium]|nr:hypothetical protein [Planctomycetota bacterium]
SLIVFDPDMEILGTWNVLKGGEESILNALDEANKKFQSKEIAWFDGEPDAEIAKGKLVVYAFVNEEEDSVKTLKALEDRWIAKDHDRMIFVKTSGREGELAKRFQVSALPTLVFVDPSQKAEKQILERKAGKSTTAALRSIQKRCFAKMKKAAEGK